MEGDSVCVDDLSVLLEFKEMGESVDEEIDDKYQITFQKLEDLEFKNMLSGKKTNWMQFLK